MEIVLILGAKGMLGGQLKKVFPDAIGWDRSDVDVLDFNGLKSKILSLESKPQTIINCVAYNDVDGAEENQQTAFALNAKFVGKLADFCREQDIVLVHFSSNYVFDGEKGEYAESDVPHPQSVYGQSKYQGEQELLRRSPLAKSESRTGASGQKNSDKFYLVRTAVLFGPKGESQASKKSFVDLMLELSQKSGNIKAVTDEINSITYVKDLADRIRYLITTNQPYGIYHVANKGCASWYDFAKEIFKITGRDVNLIPISSAEFSRQAKRPKKAVLKNTRLPEMRSWQEALKEFLSSK